jgi:transposase
MLRNLQIRAARFRRGNPVRGMRRKGHPYLELSNNLAENSMRPVALSRKNWIHIGSPQAGPKVAAILSVVESCRRLKLPVRDYLATILPELADLPTWRLPELTPKA